MSKRLKITVTEEPDVLDMLVDLHKQATTERSHFYVAKCVSEAIAEIEYLRGLLADERYIQMKADYAKGHKSWANMINEREARRPK